MHRVFIFFSRSSDCGRRVNQSNLPARLQTSGGGGQVFFGSGVRAPRYKFPLTIREYVSLKTLRIGLGS